MVGRYKANVAIVGFAFGKNGFVFAKVEFVFGKVEFVFGRMACKGSGWLFGFGGIEFTTGPFKTNVGMGVCEGGSVTTALASLVGGPR